MNASMVLLAVNDFPPLAGGEATLYHGLARHLPARDTLILAPRAEGDADIDRALAVEVARRWLPPHRSMPSRMARALVAGTHLAALLARRPVRFLVCGQLLSLGVPSRAVAQVSGVPYAVFVHGADLADYHRHPVWGRLTRWVIAGAEIVLVNSRFTAGLIERLLPGVARRIIVLPMGVDPPRRIGAAELEGLRRRHRLGEGPVLLSVSRLVPMKGHDVVIRALRALGHRFPGLRYLVAGSGPARGDLERLAEEERVRDRVVFAGFVPAEELPAHYRLATLFVQLSRVTGEYDGLEGFGLSFLEAASHGLPAIAGRSGGVPEAVQEGETALLVPPEDPEAFGSAAARLLADPAERARMSGAALRWAAAHTWERSARSLRAVIAPGEEGD